MCAETIKAAARICPHCQSRQSRFALWREEVSGAVVGAIFAAFAIGVFVWLFPEEPDVSGRSFARHRDDLLVSGSSLSLAKGKSGFWLTGYLTNRGEHPWRVHQLEVRFLDKRSNLLDVRHPESKELFVVQPRRDHAFRVDLGKLVFTNSDVTPIVRVHTATDGNQPLEVD